MPVVTTVADALRAVGRPGPEPPFRPVILSGPNGYFVPIAIPLAGDTVDWRGFWVDKEGVRFLGAPAPEIAFPHPELTPATRQLLNLVSASGMTLLERVTDLDNEIAGLPVGDTLTSPKVIEALHRRVLFLRRHVGRLTAIVGELHGPLGASFPDLGLVYDEVAHQVDRLHTLTQSVESTLRDIVMMRAAAESNRISVVANRLGETSNRIGSLANNSNVRMLGIAYLALVVALFGAALLIPETVSTVLSMPSAGWVPGYWVVLVLVLSTAIPLAVIFSRPWLVRILRGLGSYEARSQEGLADIPETTPSGQPLAAPPKGGAPK